MAKKSIQMPRIGAHMSIAGGVSNALERGKILGCETIQIFLRNNNQWQGKAMRKEETRRYKSMQKKYGIYPVVGHAIYLVNLASSYDENRNKSIQAIENDLIMCEKLGIAYLVLHAGSHLGSGIDEGIRQLASALNILTQVTSRVQILIETTSGEGSQIGYDFQQLEKILNLTHEKVGICFDTCHVFAAGYRLNTEQGFHIMVNEIKKTIGFKSIKVIHANDSKRECGSHVDRHQHIGKGHIGIEGFKLLLNFPPFRSLPFILETPKETNNDGIDMDLINMALLKSVIT